MLEHSEERNLLLAVAGYLHDTKLQQQVDLYDYLHSHPTAELQNCLTEPLFVRRFGEKDASSWSGSSRLDSESQILSCSLLTT